MALGKKIPIYPIFYLLRWTMRLKDSGHGVSELEGLGLKLPRFSMH